MNKRQRREKRKAAQAHVARQADRKREAVASGQPEARGYVSNGRGGWRPLGKLRNLKITIDK
jgi:hypothetical protein